MLHPRQFRELVIRPVLDSMSMGGDAAEQLLLGTALVESNLEWLKQMGGGPALGIYQMEPATHDDIWRNYIGHNVKLRNAALQWAPEGTVDHDDMVGNLYYATAMARLQYRRRPEPLPAAGDFLGMAAYWKQHYNTYRGKGDPAEFLARVKANRHAF